MNELILHESTSNESPITMDNFIEMMSAGVASKLASMLPLSGPAKIAKKMTLAELMHYWLEKYAKLHLKRWVQYEREFNRYLLPLADKDINEITRSDILALQSALFDSNGKYAANHATDLLSMIYNKAIYWEMFEGNSPASRIRDFRTKPRERFLQPHELGPWFAAVSTLRNETTRDLLLMLLFTGQRRRNVCEMKWEQISEEFGFWRIDETKNGDSHVVPLIAPALEILERRKGCHPIWVFPKQDGSGPMWSLSQAWSFVLERANIEGLQIHDLRRSMGSWQAINGESLPIIGRTLNHRSLASTQIYAKLHLEPVKVAMEKAVGAMFEAAGKEMPTSSTPKKRAKTALPQVLFMSTDTKNMEERICQLPTCGVTYKCRKRSRSMYCQNRCKQLAKRKDNPVQKPILGTRRCNFCGSKYQYKSSRSQLCSDGCKTKHRYFRNLKKSVEENCPLRKAVTVWQDGLGIRENPKGPASFLCKFRLNGIQILYTLGRANELSMDEAKALAKQAQCQSLLGIYPRP